jgi:beta-glucanase (GH16 family)
MVTYIFQDEFDGPAGSAPDPAKWGYDLGRWTENSELETYTSSRRNSFLTGNGQLVIRATRSGSTYQSARLKTIGKFSHYHGAWEARIKLNIQPGLWPAWWMIGANFPDVGWPACGEVDMLENYGESIVETSVHTPNNAGTDILARSAQVPCDSGWHAWRMSWNAGTGNFQFYKDDIRYLTVEPSQLKNWCFSSGVPMFLIMNLAVGGAAGTPPPSVRFPVDMLVDYVRVWDGG